MNFLKGKATIAQLQLLVWVAVYFIIFFSFLARGWPLPGGYIQRYQYHLLHIGDLWEHQIPVSAALPARIYFIYVILVVVLLPAAGLARGFLVMFIYNKYFAVHPEKISASNISQFLVAGVLTYMLSFIFRIAIAYFKLKQQAEEILLQKSQAELNLLKSQVQPHFLFNTLNNIYYEAYREAPRTAGLIERLSDIMRYFVDESPKDEVSLQTEVQFIENYIALEKIRIRHETEINFVKEYNPEARIPPMLLMTFVENIFKHGIDKSSKKNKIDISLIHQDSYMLFQTSNNKIQQAQETTHGFGIQNLRKRLTLLYGTAFELNIDCTQDQFTAFLKVPLS